MSEPLASKLLLVDGSSYLFRAYHAMPPLMNAQGMPTGAIYGVVNMLKKLLQENHFDYIAVVFDTKSKNFRHRLYPAYKSNRLEMPPELAQQIAPLYTLIEALGIPLIKIEGVEADDVIGTLTQQAEREGMTVVISSGDKDLAQLVNPQVTLMNTMNATLLDEAGVLAKFGVRPDQIVDYLTLVGDAVDHIPGVPKVGPKTAAKWLQEHQNLATLIQNATQLKGKVGEYFRSHIDQLPLGQQLVTLQKDVPLSIRVSELALKATDEETLVALYTQLEFKTWLKALAKEPVTPPRVTYPLVLTQEAFLDWIQRLSKTQAFAIDTETTSLDVGKAELVGLSFCDGVQAAYVPLMHDYPECPAQLSKKWVLEHLRPLLENPDIKKIGQNIKYDLHIFAKENIHLSALEDTMLQSYVLNSVASAHDMDTLASKHLNYETIRYEAVAGKGAKQILFSQVSLQDAADYAAEDADVTYQLFGLFSKRLSQTPSLEKVYHEIDKPLIAVLGQMEQKGICIAPDKLATQSEEVAQKLNKIEEEVSLLAGETINLNSSKQLQVLFYEKLGLPVLEKTPKGAPSTAENVLQILSLEYELPALILQHRTLSKLKTTYLDKLPGQINPHTQRIHTSYHQAVTATGRLSSSDPNLQNIPIRTQEGRRIRQAFIPRQGWTFLSADYSQIELRIMAHLSEDAGLIKAFLEGQDIHCYTASEVFGVTLEAVSAEQRRKAKAINFGLIYGMSGFGLARQLGVAREEAQAYLEQYFDRYPGVKRYMQVTREQAFEQGYVETLLGRRLYLPDIQSKQAQKRNAAQRAAINAPMQGTAADIIKLAMIGLHETLKHREDISLLLQVHDELVFEVAPQALDFAKAHIVQQMMSPVKLAVPLEVNLGIGQDWDQAHP